MIIFIWKGISSASIQKVRSIFVGFLVHEVSLNEQKA
jgi:hypothetical protein